MIGQLFRNRGFYPLLLIGGEEKGLVPKLALLERIPDDVIKPQYPASLCAGREDRYLILNDLAPPFTVKVGSEQCHGIP